MVKWSKTPPFHGGNMGSNPVGVTNYGRLAQLGERLPYKQDVSSSILLSPTRMKRQTVQCTVCLFLYTMPLNCKFYNLQKYVIILAPLLEGMNAKDDYS